MAVIDRTRAAKIGGSGAETLQRRSLLLLLLAFLGIVLLREISDPDIWFYLVVAREIVATLAIPAREFYLFPAIGEPAVFSALGFGLLHYAAYTLAGYFGMALLNALLVAGALTILAATALPRPASVGAWPPLLCVLAGAYALLEFRAVYRPETTLYLCLAVEILLLERWLADGRCRRLLWLPVLTWGITQLHTTAMLLTLVFGAYVCHCAVGGLRNRSAAPARQSAFVVAVGAAMLLLPLLNPNGGEQLLILFRTLSAGTSNNIEFLATWSTEYRWHWVGLALVVTVAWFASPRRRLVDALLLAGFGWLAFRYVRNLGLFALVAVVPVSRTLVHHAATLAPEWRRRAGGGLAVAASVVFVAVTWANGGWGIGVRKGMFFEDAVPVIQRIARGGNVMNFFHHGGYLAWALGRDYRLAVDGHFVRPSFADEYHDRVMRADPDWESLLARFDVSIVATPATLPFSGALIPLVERLADDPRWRLLATEKAGLLFAADGVGSDIPALDKRQVWRQVQREADETLRTYPDHQQAIAARKLAQRRLADRR